MTVKARVEFPPKDKLQDGWYEFDRVPSVDEYVYTYERVWAVRAVYHPLTFGQPIRLRVGTP